MNKSTLKKLIESLTDEVIAEKKLEEGRPFKVNPKYTHFFVLKSNNKIVNGFEYEKDTDRESIARYAKEDLKDMDLKPSEVSVLTVKGCKQKGIDPFNWDSWNKNSVDEKTVISSTDGTEKTLTSDQKKKVQMAADGGDTVQIKKKGMPLAESDDDVSDEEIKDGLNTFKEYCKKNGIHSLVDLDNPDAETIENIKSLVKAIRKEKIDFKKSANYIQPKKKDDSINESEETTSPAPEINVAEAIDSAISSLSQTSESTENATYKRLAEKTLRILNTAKEAYSKLAEKMSLDEEKDSDKHVEQVKKHIGKKIKDKKDLEPIMSKYHKVAKKLSSVTKDPVKTADALWKHILKEHKDI